MANKQPIGKMKRAVSGGGVAAKVGGKLLLHYAKRPFLKPDACSRDQEIMIRENAEILFQGLSLLKGTAVKLAQQLSLEMDLLPEAACRELSKACYQVPPINRALVRRTIIEGLGKAPEKLFAYLDLNAFAAASLGQVHMAKDKDNRLLAVKIQYPGIAKTIDSDMDLLRKIFRPLIQKDQLLSIVEEVSARLHEEVDYRKEAENIGFFYEHLCIDGIHIPKVFPELSANTVLTTTFMPGKPLNQWMMDTPSPAAIDHVAQQLYQIFITGIYELHHIHADPNPGNFIIADDLSIGLVDYGCMKQLDPGFVNHYRRLVIAANYQNKGDHFQEMVTLGLLPKHLAKPIRIKIQEVSNAIGKWFGRLCEKERFDFSAHPDFFAEGRKMMQQYHTLRQYVQINPDFIFLDRTRYGLLRLFEQMGTRVSFRNPYEWENPSR